MLLLAVTRLLIPQPRYKQQRQKLLSLVTVRASVPPPPRSLVPLSPENHSDSDSDSSPTVDSSDSLSYADSFLTICSEDDIEVYTLEYEKEDEDLFFFKNLCINETEDGIQTMIFSTTDLDALKEKEKNLRAKEDSKYFRNKEVDSNLYEQIMECMKPYLADDKLKMLMHPWSTQLNEALNNSISSYAPKTKMFCRTMSLRTRIVIAAVVQGLGYLAFWTRVFQELGITMDHAFASSLTARDRKNNRKREYQKSKKDNLVRRKEYLHKRTKDK